MHRLQGEHLENEDVEGTLQKAGGGGWHAARTDILYEVGAGHKSEAKYRLLETPVPFQGRIGMFAVDFSVQVARSGSAREAMLTRYAMPGFELMEKLPRRAEFSFFRAPPLADAFLHVGAGGNVEQALDHRGAV